MDRYTEIKTILLKLWIFVNSEISHIEKVSTWNNKNVLKSKFSRKMSEEEEFLKHLFDITEASVAASARKGGIVSLHAAYLIVGA